MGTVSVPIMVLAKYKMSNFLIIRQATLGQRPFVLRFGFWIFSTAELRAGIDWYLLHAYVYVPILATPRTI